MRALYRIFWLPLYRRYALWYVRKRRVWRYRGLRLEIPPGVFHPGIYFSTPFLLRFMEKLNLKGKTTLDVGTGSGAIAIKAACQGAQSWAVDIHHEAVTTARENAKSNHCEVRALHSDLFDALPAGVKFDVVLANPPYYPRNPVSPSDHAFYAGENHDYFHRFFEGVRAICYDDSQILMVLSEDCDLERIHDIAKENGLHDLLVKKHFFYGEKFYILKYHFVIH